MSRWYQEHESINFATFHSLKLLGNLYVRDSRPVLRKRPLSERDQALLCELAPDPVLPQILQPVE